MSITTIIVNISNKYKHCYYEISNKYRRTSIYRNGTHYGRCINKRYNKKSCYILFLFIKPSILIDTAGNVGFNRTSCPARFTVYIP
jgi:hypothetical protein